MVETCSTSYVYIKQVKYIPTPVIFIEDIPNLFVVSTVII
jgi:glutaredoxin